MNRTQYQKVGSAASRPDSFIGGVHGRPKKQVSPDHLPWAVHHLPRAGDRQRRVPELNCLGAGGDSHVQPLVDDTPAVVFGGSLCDGRGDGEQRPPLQLPGSQVHGE
jgi:hypothetical protein